MPVTERVVWERPFCRLLHFAKALPPGTPAQPKLLIVAPVSGHYATLLRGTVATMLPDHDVYITDWIDARMVPLADGPFDLDDYIDYLIAIHHHLGPGVHVMAVCQPSVPVLAAVALMEAAGDRHLPASMTLMGGPIDTRVNPTAVNTLANTHDLDWFRQNVIMKVPFPHPGFMRDVYPGFLQISGFLSMNFDRHLDAHRDFYHHLIRGDGDSAEKHREFYDEYLAVMDLTAEFYLQTVDTVFLRHALPQGRMMHRDRKVEPAAITHVAMLTVEGEHDDISGVGQTRAAHDLAGQPAGRQARPPPATGRRPLRRLQRHPLPRRDRPAHCRIHRHPRRRRPPQAGQRRHRHRRQRGGAAAKSRIGPRQGTRQGCARRAETAEIQGYSIVNVTADRNRGLKPVPGPLALRVRSRCRQTRQSGRQVRQPNPASAHNSGADRTP